MSPGEVTGKCTQRTAAIGAQASKDRPTGSHTHPPPVCSWLRAGSEETVFTGSESAHRSITDAAQCPGPPFARRRRYRRRRDVPASRRRTLSSFLAPTGPCARPSPSHRLWSPLVGGSSQVVATSAGPGENGTWEIRPFRIVGGPRETWQWWNWDPTVQSKEHGWKPSAYGARARVLSRPVIPHARVCEGGGSRPSRWRPR
jgi:hypothetical protein